MKQETIKNSEAEKQKKINEADGQAQAILLVAKATSEGIRQVAIAINSPGGNEAVKLRVAEEYVKEFGKLAKTNNTIIVPADISSLAGMVASAMSVLDQTKAKHVVAV